MNDRVQSFLWSLFGGAFAVALIVGITVFAFRSSVISYSKARASAHHNQCVYNLDLMASFKTSWAEANSATQGTFIPASAFHEHLTNSGKSLLQPHGTNAAFESLYRLNPIGQPPVCLVNTNHRLSQGYTTTK